jgi:hypothetical protein
MHMHAVHVLSTESRTEMFKQNPQELAYSAHLLLCSKNSSQLVAARDTSVTVVLHTRTAAASYYTITSF